MKRIRILGKRFVRGAMERMRVSVRNTFITLDEGWSLFDLISLHFHASGSPLVV